VTLPLVYYLLKKKCSFLQLLGIVCPFYLFYLFEPLTNPSTYRSVQSWQEKKLSTFFGLRLKVHSALTIFLKFTYVVQNSLAYGLSNCGLSTINASMWKNTLNATFFSFIFSYAMDTSSSPKPIKMCFFFKFLSTTSRL